MGKQSHVQIETLCIKTLQSKSQNEDALYIKIGLGLVNISVQKNVVLQTTKYSHPYGNRKNNALKLAGPSHMDCRSKHNNAFQK